MAESRGGARGLMILLAFLLLGNMQIADCIFLERQPRVFAIDLGATYSCGVYKKGEVQIIANEQGNRVTPSLVGFTDNETLIGEAAKNQTASNPERTIFDVKRLIGRKFDDEEVQRAMKVVPYKIVNKEGKPYIEVKIKDGETKLSSPEEISAMILHKMKESAEAFLGEKIEEDAVITVPAYFNDAQRQSTKDAGVIAGLNVIGIIDEPTAAVIAYDLNLQRDKLKILVFNLGGHTFDATILKIDNRAIDVLSTIVDSHLGGEDFDQRIMEYLIESIKNKYGKDMSNKADDVAKLRREAELAKRALSTQHQVRVEIESFFNESLSRSRFEELNDDLFKKTLVHVEKAMKDAGLEDKKEIDEIVLAGGSSRIPKVQQLLRDYFDGKELNMGMNPDEVVAYGAAIQGAFLYRQLNPPSYFVNPSKVPRLSQDEIELMVLEAEVWANKDKDDCNRLETYLKKLINDEDGKVEAAAKEGLKWLDRWGFPRKETYEEKLKEVEAVCKRQPNTETMTTTLVTSYTAS